MWILDIDSKLFSFLQEGNSAGENSVYRLEFMIVLLTNDLIELRSVLLIACVSAKIINEYKCLLYKHILLTVTTCMCANYVVLKKVSNTYWWRLQNVPIEYSFLKLLRENRETFELEVVVNYLSLKRVIGGAVHSNHTEKTLSKFQV